MKRGTDKFENEQQVHRRRSDAIANMYDAHVDEVYRFLYRRCQDDELSKDITQETFLSVVRGKANPEDITIAWLVTTARNRLFDVLRRQRNYEDRIRLMVVGVEADVPGDLVERLRVESALQQLRINYRIVLTLHYIDGYSVPAMAEHLGRSPKSIEALVTRARRALRAELEANGGGRYVQ